MRASIWLLGVATILSTSSAYAQSADELFQQGVQLSNRGETKIACEKFTASYKLDPAPGTLFNLAGCHEKEGRLTLARGEFNELVTRATAAGKADKAQVARERADAIEKRLPKIALTFTAASNATEIIVDGQPLAKDAWQKPVATDPGNHAIEFRAAGKTSATRNVTLAGEGTSTPVDVPKLVDPNAPAEPVAPVAGKEPASSHVEPPAEAPSGGGKRTLGFIVGGAGLAVLGVGVVFGVTALSQKSDADAACGGSGNACTNEASRSTAQGKLEDARTSGLISTIGVGVGVVAVGVGAYLVFTGGAKSASTTASSGGVRLAPAVGSRSQGFMLSGAF
ncbi:MAG: hypothetical protein JWM74_1534 [Myxococcaceae bacterium]|nr:hypothetical protein [Myxococcaceae bacterium]